MWQLDWSKLAVLTYDPQQPMIFNSGLFLFLFLGFSLVYALLQKKMTARLLFVTAFSYYFYYKSSGIYFFLLGIVTVSDFLLAEQRHLFLLVGHRDGERFPACPANGAYRCALETEAVGRDQLVH